VTTKLGTTFEISAFTVGFTKSYDASLESQPAVYKTGLIEDEGYPGGWVWRTREEAEAFLSACPGFDGYSVYGLVLQNGWEEDVSKEPNDDGVHNLLHNARIFKLSDCEET